MANQHLLTCIEQADREKGLRAVMAESSLLHWRGQLWGKFKAVSGASEIRALAAMQVSFWVATGVTCSAGCLCGGKACIRRICTQQQWEGGNCICF